MPNAFDEYERELWDGRADAYERGFAHLTAYTVGFLLDAAGVRAGTRVLDVGTGPGVVAAEAVRRGAKVSAVDADPGMARTAARNVPEADVRVAVLPGLPHEDGAFDAVVGNFVINHVGEPVTVVRELRRVLCPGGRLALTCWVLPGSGALGIIKESMDEVGVEWPADVPVTPFMEYGNPEGFAGLLKAAGLDDVTVRELDWEHVVDPEEWWQAGPMARVGSNGVILARQTPEVIAEVKAEYRRRIASHTRPGGEVALPAHALLAHGVSGSPQG
ncbi:Methyltransferase domain-containing protein [Thermomonospora echinospora]|uniref:Methyltransferase domain-containing protein n=1 Tax=Thermomonospora echinospora TaxID=1992 RepID=A0A1H6CUC6_9ACTN|nr:class I SAM-dependent methyltransferase [Thermomonospora echinospora]SEG76681.1 Methyltransferase domain-containing protein [Thermomonospora echinospora]